MQGIQSKWADWTGTQGCPREVEELGNAPQRHSPDGRILTDGDKGEKHPRRYPAGGKKEEAEFLPCESCSLFQSPSPPANIASVGGLWGTFPEAPSANMGAFANLLSRVSL